jgi:predicted glycogen debranching enzyme
MNAVLQYLKYTGDFQFVSDQLWENLIEIVDCHIQGTEYGIRMDSDGLLDHGPRLTWMDAEVDGKAVTPRAGKAVEIQALWYNALKIMALLSARFGEKRASEKYSELAQRGKMSFNRKFWNNEKNCLYDVLAQEGADESVRPNQVIAAALDFAILDSEKIPQVVERVENELLTPCGLRTLSRSDSKYSGICYGDRRTRDTAYHNGTVWPWLLGPFVSAYTKFRKSSIQSLDYASKSFIEPLFSRQIHLAGLGVINEIYDGDAPHTPRGCISQAWSIAEPLRAYIEDILQIKPKFEKIIVTGN